MEILYLIPARGGSKGIPGKNLKEIGGIPLIGFKIISALRSSYKGRVVVSTDDERIAAVARDFGAEVPFMRPAELATDTAASIDVDIHALEWFEKNEGKKFDLFMRLEPSSPFGTYRDLEECVRILVEKNARAVYSVKEVAINSVFVNELGEDGRMDAFYERHLSRRTFDLRRQDFKKEYTMNGAVCLARADHLREKRIYHSYETYAYIMNEYYSLEIDEEVDLRMAGFFAQEKLIDMSWWKR